MINYIVGWLLLVVVHELGHIFCFRLYGKFPPIYFKWWGIQIGNKEFCNNYTLRQISIISLTGVFTGSLIIPLFTNNTSDILLYIIICGVDLFNVFQFYTIDKKFRDIKLSRIKFVIDGD